MAYECDKFPSDFDFAGFSKKSKLKKFTKENLKVTVSVRPSTDHDDPAGTDLVLAVQAVGISVDRKEVAGWIFDLKQGEICARLKSCIEAGKAFTSYEIKRDVNGKSYISAEQAGFFHKHHMNSALKRLGF